MHLKRLEAFGFKSFADKVVLDFEPGFTGLVGPNGCGKSNVVDAVKWVLGEQSAKSLRGGEMLDVLFNGSAHRKPLNFSEVTLTFDNASGMLPLGAPEVAVTRRLYRSGESEYLINKALCRLRDVRELFWDTGIGTSSYSIIEQGRVAMLLEANSKERRFLFEEAAGIHKYKERKKIALRKLERVEQNIARLADVLGEVERNLRSVTRQAQRAAKAKELGDALRAIRLEVLLHEAFTSQAALREEDGALAGAQDQCLALATELSQAQAATAQEQETMVRLDEELSSAQRELSDLRAALAALEEAVKSERRAAEEMRAESERAREAAREAGARAAALASEREKTEFDLDNARNSLSEKESRIRTLGGELAAAQAEHEQTGRDLDAARRESMDQMGRRGQLQQSLSQAEADLSGIDYRIRKARAEVTKAEDLLRFAQREAEDVRRRAEQLRKRRETLETEQAGARALQARTEDEIERLTEQAQDERNQLEQIRSRVAVLEQLIESGEGLSPGARAVRTTLHEGGADGGDLHGLVAECLRVYEHLEAAVEAALGNEIETLVVGSEETAQRLLERLRADGLGRATFIALERLASPRFDPLARLGLDETAVAAAGCLGRAADLVAKECEEPYRPVAEAVLGDVLVFDSLANAKAAHDADPAWSRWRRVTLDGELLEPGGALGGGKHRFDRKGPIGRRNEIQRLTHEMEERRMKLEALAERSAFLEKRAQALARDDERLGSTLASLAASGTELKGVLAAIQREESRSAEEKRVAVDEIRELDAERSLHAQRIHKLRDEVEQLKGLEAASQARVNDLTAALARHESLVGERRGALEELKRDASALAERAQGLERHLQSLSAQFAEKRDEADRERCRADSLDARREVTEAAAAEKEASRAEQAERCGALETRVRGLSEEKENARLRFEDARGRERAAGSQLDVAKGQAGDIERRRIELRLRLDQKLEEARREFGLDAEAELAQRGGPPQVSEEMRAEAEKLALRLERLGPVNMYALEEQKQLEERLGFLKTQHDDLQSARSSLRDVIARINRKSRSKFQETFEAVRLHFQEIFRKLFGGGKADLILEEGEDILEAGIEITARPPGKEPRSIRQLSGGEKAMTTIALLFAVFRSRPAPFCILDEVDAPLDEANVDRFNTLVREFLDRSQFVVITHNKKTMGYANMLYGITMPEPGVSKRIAIKYEEIERHLPMDEIDRQAAEAREAAQARIEKAGAGEVDDVPAAASAEAGGDEGESARARAESADVEAGSPAGGGGGGAGD
ncbi:MAG: chromosome segregation protein SMC [Planctomycetota bacterium]|nr:chromosome segregation protein SMC [Planctomycetota bacterium]